MERTKISELPERIGEKVRISGWLETIRNQKTMQFLIIKDGTGSVQAVHYKPSDPELAAAISSLTCNSALTIHGTIVENKAVKAGGLEIQIGELEILNLAKGQLPFSGDASQPIRLDWRFIDLWSEQNQTIFKIQTFAEQAMREFWQQEGFIEIHSPKLMSSASESAAELFKLDYFGSGAFLAQSPQFFKQMAMAARFGKIFEVGDVFRADPSFTSHHATEFTSIDMEISFIKSHEDVMDLEERWLNYVIGRIAEVYGKTIRELFQTEVTVPTIPFPRITMEKAQRLLKSLGHVPSADTKPGDIDRESEKILSEWTKKEYGHEFVFVTEYPASIRPFYHMRLAENPEITKSFDLLWKGLEVTTGAQREHRPEILRRQIAEKGLSAEALKWYVDFFEYGCPPHGGLGFGLARMMMLLLGFKNIKDVTYLFRGPNRLSP
jgi:nondiscriminating aspartyl-tRNA synthetase